MAGLPFTLGEACKHVFWGGFLVLYVFLFEINNGYFLY